MIRKRCGSIVGLAAAVALASVGIAQTSYVVEPLGDVAGGDFWSRAFAINDNGWIVGESKITEGVDPRRVAVRWLPGMLQPAMLSGAGDFDFSRGNTINNDNLIGGFAEVLDPFEPSRSFLWTEGGGFDFFMDEFNNPDIKGSQLFNVTEYGTLLGFIQPEDTNLGVRGFRFDLDTRELVILNPVGPDGNLSLAHGMTESGLIVGAASDDPAKKPSRGAVYWPEGSDEAQFFTGMDDLNDLYDDVTAGWIGADGTIRGNAGNRDVDGTLFAQNVVWVRDPDTEEITMLGGLDGFDWVKVRGSNADGSMLAGFAYQEGEHTISFLKDHVGVIWTEATGWVDVNTLIVKGPADFDIIEVTGVSENGLLCGSAVNADGAIEAVRLSPACLVLTVDNLVVDENVMITVEGGTPGERTVVLWGFGGAPSSFIDVNNWCATFGFQVRLQGRKIRVAFDGIFDADGRIMREREVRSKAQGLTLMFQAAERGTCPNQCTSNIVTRVVQ